VFGHKNGLASRSSRQFEPGLLARVKAQIARRAEEEADAGGAAAAEADAVEEGVGEYTSFLLLL
jgi:hypothetical protein